MGLVIIVIIVLGLAQLAWAWASGIDHMQKEHPDYRGEEFLNWDRKHDGWDDNKIHSEGGF